MTTAPVPHDAAARPGGHARPGEGGSTPGWRTALVRDQRPAALGRAPGWRRFGPLLGLVWVVFLAEPLTTALAAEPPALRVLGVIGVAGVAAVYGFSVYALRFQDAPARVVVTVLAVQTAFVALTSLAAHQHGMVGLVFVGVTSVFLVRRRTALVVLAVIVVVLLVVPRLVPGWESEDSTALSAVLAGLAVFAFTQLVARNRQLFVAQEEVATLAAAHERERLARDVHDVVGHSLTVVSVKAELAARLLREDPDRAAAELADIQRLTRSALADVRSMVTGARPVTLPGELAAARAAFDAAGIEAALPGTVDTVPPARQELFAWALREATTNVLRHSLARRVVVALGQDSIIVDDDGRGPDAGALADGSGLRGLGERSRAAGATLSAGRGPLGGFRIAVRFGSAQTDGRIAP
ncbi:sensor histidine kinase [Xylanimonas allomyrinae]|uniref:Sensor histidine kinase n=1 Tax=Xylanimonas allomyrinae TaxID=2509459 RepID=A0A4P6EMN9_9MICO|nr:sensor histidine kinase [Xylanimonas allomyrinae]QAY63023.1 sensor histidine kinase [Xylanimonas allomyrinae]